MPALPGRPTVSRVGDGRKEVTKMANLSEAIRKSVPRVMRVGASGEPQVTEQGGLHDALRVREQIIGARMLERTYDELEHEGELKRVRQQADLAEARARELEATVKLEGMKAKVPDGNGSSGGQPSPLMMLMSSLIDNLQGQNQNLVTELKETRDSVLGQAIEGLRKEIASLQSQTLTQGATHTRADSVEGFLDRIEEVRKAVDVLRGFSPAIPELGGAQTDFNSLMMMRRMNDEMILKLEEFKDRRDQTQWDRMMERERLNLEERRSERMASTLGQYAPLIKGLAYEKLGIDQPAEEATQAPACPACQAPLALSNDRSVAFCPVCSQTYKVSGE